MLAFFISIRFIDVLDILLVAFLLYQVFKLLKDSIATYIFIGFFFIYLVWLIVKALNMEMLSLILGQFMGVGIIALIVVFQQELRRFLLMIGRKYFGNINIHFIEDIIKVKTTIQTEENHQTIKEIIKAVTDLSQTKTGAIIVVSDFLKLNNFVETGVALNATVNHQTLISIFFKNNPLHDGAVIIHRNKILAAKVILPINNEIFLNEKYGTRHRSALSMNMETDVLAKYVARQLDRTDEKKEGVNMETLKLSGFIR
jgi:uncharacterized protein (TIGR00159 family)